MLEAGESAAYEPPDWLARWIDRVSRGPALDLGAGEGALSRWLAERGFQVEAIEPDREQADRLVRGAEGLQVEVVEATIQTAALTSSHYTLVVAGAVLHFLRPSELPETCTRLSQALKPAGYLMAEVFTVDDPSFERYRHSEVEPLEENTYPLLERDGVIHYFAPGELRRLFANLEVLEYEESRRAVADDEFGFRAGATLVARKPEQT